MRRAALIPIVAAGVTLAAPLAQTEAAILIAPAASAVRVDVDASLASGVRLGGLTLAAAPALGFEGGRVGGIYRIGASPSPVAVLWLSGPATLAGGANLRAGAYGVRMRRVGGTYFFALEGPAGAAGNLPAALGARPQNPVELRDDPGGAVLRVAIGAQGAELRFLAGF
jgi:hypothetical protein